MKFYDLEFLFLIDYSAVVSGRYFTVLVEIIKVMFYKHNYCFINKYKLEKNNTEIRFLIILYKIHTFFKFYSNLCVFVK